MELMDQTSATLQRWLESAIASLGGVAGTVHVQCDTNLHLRAAHNIPTAVLEVVRHLPQGKGMAGTAQVRKRPVQTCDLQTDTSGDIRPGARAVGAQAAIALPVLDEEGRVRAVVGFAWGKEMLLTPEQVQAMEKLVANLPET